MSNQINNALVTISRAYCVIVQPIGLYLGVRDFYNKESSYYDDGREEVNFSSSLCITGASLFGGLVGIVLAPVAVPVHFYRKFLLNE